MSSRSNRLSSSRFRGLLGALLLCGLLAVLLCRAGSTASISYYVSDALGSDLNAGTHPAFPKKTIQAGIDAAFPGDVVRVADGIYTGAGNTSLSLRGKAITLRSERGPSGCILDGGGSEPAFALGQGETWESVIEGFTARRGSGSTVHSSPTLRNCWFVGNLSRVEGNFSRRDGGAMFVGGSPRVLGCVFVGNKARHGGAIAVEGSDLTLANCLFLLNEALDISSGGGGGAIVLRSEASGVAITHCAFVGNRAGFGSAIELTPRARLDLSNSIIWGNQGSWLMNADGILTLSHSDIQGGFAGSGNLNVDPKFVRLSSPGSDGQWGTADDDYGDLRLSRDSPCVNRASAVSTEAAFLTTDLAGSPRQVGAAPDMGSYEVQNAAPVAESGEAQVAAVPHDGSAATNMASFDLDGSASSDPDSDPLSYEWTDESGTLIATTARVIGVTRYPRIEPFTFTLTVTDPFGAFSIAEVSVQVDPETNQPPTADPGDDRVVAVPHDGNPATGRVRVTLDGRGSVDPDGDPLTYDWTDEAGARVFDSAVYDPVDPKEIDKKSKQSLDEIRKGAPSGAVIRVDLPARTEPYVFTLTVQDSYAGVRPKLIHEGELPPPPGGVDTEQVRITVLPEPNAVPLADAGPDRRMKQTGDLTPVTLDGASSDPDGDTLSYHWTEGGTALGNGPSLTTDLAPGKHLLTLTVEDPYGATASDSLEVVVDGTPPATTVRLEGPAGANGWYRGAVTVTLTAADPDPSDLLSTCYRVDGGAAQPYTGPFSVLEEGIHTLTFWSVDAVGSQETDRSASIKIDTTAPEITASANTTRLWPPNGKLVPVTVSGRIVDGSSGVEAGSTRYATVDSEGQVQPAGSFHPSEDGSCFFTVQLPASRAGKDREGRTFTVTVTARDQAGNPTSRTVTIHVPHDQR